MGRNDDTEKSEPAPEAEDSLANDPYADLRAAEDKRKAEAQKAAEEAQEG